MLGNETTHHLCDRPTPINRNSAFSAGGIPFTRVCHEYCRTQRPISTERFIQSIKREEKYLCGRDPSRFQ